MKVRVRNTLDRKYMLPGTVMTDPYTEEKDGSLYLAADSEWGRTWVLCVAIVSTQIEEES